MVNRPSLQTFLEELLGSHNAYYQPPESVKMKYPAIVYSRKKLDNKHANNAVYNQSPSYELIVIDKDPDSEIVRKVSMLPKCTHDRTYTSDNLNHDVFTLFY